MSETVPIADLSRLTAEDDAALFVFDADTQVLRAASPAAQRLCGAPAAALLGRRFADLFAPAAGRDLRLRTFDPDGWVDVGATVVPTDGPARDRLVLVRPHGGAASQDGLRERERREKELIHGTRLGALGQIAASVAHDLRNPLGAIRNMTYYLQRKVPADQPKWGEYLRLIEREVVRCSQVIDNLMDLARPRAPARETFDLDLILWAAVGDVGTPPGVRWHVEVNPRPLLLYADPAQVRQVLDRLLRNAVDALGGPGDVWVRAGVAGDQARIEIVDTGPGIPPEHRPALFQPLFTTKAKGSGLGLWVSRQMIERHGGALRLLDTAGPGAAFEILLPLGGGPRAKERHEDACS